MLGWVSTIQCKKCLRVWQGELNHQEDPHDAISQAWCTYCLYETITVSFWFLCVLLFMICDITPIEP
jgi:hypothetical protein